ncbi:MAG: hypothetical protein ABSF63_01615 [Candidatus Bathyarchaeia archaeon]
MKQPKTDYYVQVQRHKTIKYAERQHYQDYIVIPSQLSETLRLQPGQVMKCVLNGNGNALTYTTTAEKVNHGKMKYEQWLEKIKPYIPTNALGKTYRQICVEAGIEMKSAPPEWVHKAKNEIALNNSIRDKKTHRILWSRVEQVKQTIQRKLPNYAEVTVRTS